MNLGGMSGAALLVAILMLSGGALAANGRVAVGSYANEANALRQAAELRDTISQAVLVTPVSVGGRELYRVEVEGVNPDSLRDELRAAGYSGAFVTARDLAPVPTLEADPPVSDPEPASPETPPAVATPATPPPGPDVPADVVARAAVPEPPDSATHTHPGQQDLKATVNGVDLHYIKVETRPHADVGIKVDGRVDEADWQAIDHWDNLIVSTPDTGKPGKYRTEYRLLATEKGLYVSGVMYQPPDTLVERLTNRDLFIDRDTMGFTLDTSGEGTFGYWFIVALGDSLMDGKVLPERRYSNSWDGPWLGRSARFDDGWSAEMFLPWSMVNLPAVEGEREIGFAFSRQVSDSNERYWWPGHPYSAPQFVSALNTMKVDGVSPRSQLAVIPYVSSVIDESRDKNTTRIGADIVWKPSAAFETTLALQPDFGAVEADEVVLNLTALEVFFPEKRLFFLEGNEIFVTSPRANPGTPIRVATNENYATTSRRRFMTAFLPTPISILNTRRIGGTASQVEVPAGVTLDAGERNLPTDLTGAAKLTGVLGNLRYGIMGAAEDDVDWFATDDLSGLRRSITAPGRDFGIARLSFEVKDRHRFAAGYIGTMMQGPDYDATVHGADLHYGSPDGDWTADFQYVESDVADVTGQGGTFDVEYQPSSKRAHRLELDYFDETVDINDIGFLRRNDYGGFQYTMRYAEPKPVGWFRGTRGAFTWRQMYNVSRGQVVDSGLFWRNIQIFPGRNTVRTGFAYLPERWEDRNSRGNGAYLAGDRLWAEMLWSTDASRTISFTFGAGGQTEDLGGYSRSGTFGFSYQPTPRLSMDLDVTYQRRFGWVVYRGGNNFGSFDGSDWKPNLKLNWFISPGHQLKFSLQWAGVSMEENGWFEVPAGDGELVRVASPANGDFSVSLLTAQLRYRWEIAPLTDLYVVFNRGNDLRIDGADDFSNLFSDVLDDPVINALIIKLRYRFAN